MATSARDWLLDHYGGDKNAVARHFVAVGRFDRVAVLALDPARGVMRIANDAEPLEGDRGEAHVADPEGVEPARRRRERAPVPGPVDPGLDDGRGVPGEAHVAVAGPIDTVDEKLLASAVEEFQCDHGLTVDGKCGSLTQAKLKKVHGC